MKPAKKSSKEVLLMKKVVFGILALVCAITFYAGAFGASEQAIKELPPEGIVQYNPF